MINQIKMNSSTEEVLFEESKMEVKFTLKYLKSLNKMS